MQRNEHRVDHRVNAYTPDAESGTFRGSEKVSPSWMTAPPTSQPEGAPLLAHEPTPSSPPPSYHAPAYSEPPNPFYRSFQTLQQHLLNHLQYELAELEYRLAAFDVHPYHPSSDRAALLGHIALKSSQYTRVARDLAFWSPASSPSVRRPSQCERAAWIASAGATAGTSGIATAAAVADENNDDYIVIAAAAPRPVAPLTDRESWATFMCLCAFAASFLALGVALSLAWRG